MSVGGVGGSSDAMMMMMNVLMEGMKQTTELSTKMIAVGIENTIIGEKMATAQNIIDVYA